MASGTIGSLVSAGLAPKTRVGVRELRLPLLVVRADAPGRLAATFSGEFTRAFLWEDDRQSLTIHPDLVARVIQAALASGWKPDLPGHNVLEDPKRLLGIT